MNRILIVEDNAALAKSISDYLTAENFHITHAASFSDAQKQKNDFDLIILDWMLPDGQGIDYLRNLRKNLVWVPVIFLTAKADLIDKVLGLESGANDYIVKPFEPRELLARIRSQLRKPETASQLIRGHNLILDLAAREVSFNGIKTESTKKEFDLLALLLTHPNKVFSREELLNKIWGFENYPTTRTVDTHVLQLRNKFGENLIQTVRGIGYRINSNGELT
jgi:DNA-binding response OmpR family regulator